MVVQLHHVYLVGVVIPNVMNEPSLAKMATALSQTEEVLIGHDALRVAPSTLNRSPYSVRRHFCVILHYNPSTKIGILLLGTSQPRQPQRFVPCEGTVRQPFQPRHVVSLTPTGGLSSAGYFNFSHALRATIMVQGDVVIQTLPPQAFLTDKYSNGNPIDVYLALSEVQALKSLHFLYWTGVRYAADGTPLGTYEGDGGAGGGGDDDGGSGSGTRGGVGGASGHLCPPFCRPVGTDGTVTLTDPPSGEGGSGSYRLARALEEEEERITQLALIAGDVGDLAPPTILACVEPMTAEAMGLIDSF